MLQDALNDRDDIDEAGDEAPYTESVQHVEPVLAELVEPAAAAPVADLTDANLNQLEKARAFFHSVAPFFFFFFFFFFLQPCSCVDVCRPKP
jgi:hypothetical protein